MKLQRVKYRVNGMRVVFQGAAVMSDFDGNVKYIIGENNSIQVFTKWDYVELDQGPLAYMDTANYVPVGIIGPVDPVDK
jgi:hypothetical protein